MKKSNIIQLLSYDKYFSIGVLLRTLGFSFIAIGFLVNARLFEGLVLLFDVIVMFILSFSYIELVKMRGGNA